MTSNKDSMRFRWVVYAFVGALLVITGLFAWQMYDLTPARWCAVAATGSPEIATGCFNVLIKLLDIKDHAVMALAGITGLTVLSLAAVALGVRIGFSGPAGLSANVGAETTTVTDGSSVVEVPTPPSEDVK